MALQAWLYEANGDLVSQLHPTDISVDARLDRACRRTAQLQVVDTDLEMLQIPNRMLKITDSVLGTIFCGWTDTYSHLRHTVQSQRGEIALYDKAQRAILNGWQEDTTYEDTTAAEPTQLSQVALASTSMAATAQIQAQARVYGRLLYATVAGIESQVQPTAESGDIIIGNYSIDYTVSGLSNLRLIICLDLQVAESVATVVLTTNGTDDIEMSSDGQTWVAFAAGALRYLRITINKAAGPITLSVVVTTSSSYPASNALLDDETSWRPTAADLDINLIISCGGSITANIVRLRLGLNRFNLLTGYNLCIERSADKITWTTIETIACAGTDVECSFTAVALQFLRISFYNWYGPRPAIRYVFIGNAVWDVAKEVLLQDIIQNIAETWDETLFNLALSRILIPAITFERGQGKWSSIQTLVQEQGWEAWYSREGYLCAGPWELNVFSPIITFDVLPTLEVEWTYDSVYNVILVENGLVDNPLIGSATNDAAWSPVSTARVGIRTSPILRVPLATTQDQLNKAAWRELERCSRGGITLRISGLVRSIPAVVVLEPGDVVVIPYNGVEYLTMVVGLGLRAQGHNYTYELVAIVL